MNSQVTDDAITRDFRIYQRKKGHRYSVDDVATAYVAAKWASDRLADVRLACDLGTGIGSVLLMASWKLTETKWLAIEAQEESFELLCQNVARNHLTHRVWLIHGDLRDLDRCERIEEKGLFQLITATPPYFPVGTAVESKDAQRSFARIEFRGGVEDYMYIASKWLNDDGAFVLCTFGAQEKRVYEAAQKTRLSVETKLDVIPRQGKATLFTVWTLRRQDIFGSKNTTYDHLVVRDGGGRITDEAHRMRIFFGMTSGRERADLYSKNNEVDLKGDGHQAK